MYFASSSFHRIYRCLIKGYILSVAAVTQRKRLPPHDRQVLRLLAARSPCPTKGTLCPSSGRGCNRAVSSAPALSQQTHAAGVTSFGSAAPLPYSPANGRQGGGGRSEYIFQTFRSLTYIRSLNIVV